MFRWLTRLLGGGTQRRSKPISAELSRSNWKWERVDECPYGHYTQAVDAIEQLKREGKHDEVIDLLRWCIDFTEAEAAAKGAIAQPVAPAYYRHLGIVLRKEKRYDEEIEVLERYVNWFEEHEGTPRKDLVDRLKRARELAENQ